ncbi:nitrate reductase molybdenum cofactor assembly chaperone [Glycomyces salinus]|uniref:nitrate reductase molybdenum cofactor assembly chaperone n=1 Tax=Glycomyces salinus TaxID=980294 RepID=UPI0018EBC2D8|nr:nitrate reductase molybdenum cofactor assembly chaperone [Glycomyces salinus]
MNALIRQAAAVLLCYPDRDFYDRLGLVRTAIAEAPQDRAARSLNRFADHAAATGEIDLGAHFVQTFDMRRRRALHMTYYTDGDTRRRGHALARLKEIYAGCGWRLADDELPDHLSVLLEFAARGDREWGRRLLAAFQPGIELLRSALHEHGTPYADVLDAVAFTLPPPGDETRRQAMRLATGGPPSEDVGLDPYGGVIPLGMPTVLDPAGGSR